MSHKKHEDEAWALALLQQIINRSNEDRDALPGSVVRLVKQARDILKKRQQPFKNGRSRTKKGVNHVL